MIMSTKLTLIDSCYEAKRTKKPPSSAMLRVRKWFGWMPLFSVLFPFGSAYSEPSDAPCFHLLIHYFKHNGDTDDVQVQYY